MLKSGVIFSPACSGRMLPFFRLAVFSACLSKRAGGLSSWIQRSVLSRAALICVTASGISMADASIVIDGFSGAS